MGIVLNDEKICQRQHVKYFMNGCDKTHIIRTRPMWRNELWPVKQGLVSVVLFF